MSDKGIYIPRVKDSFILIAWIAGLLLIGGLCWFLTRSVRTDFLKNSINNALIKMGDPRSLEAPITLGNIKSGRASGPLSPQGQWFKLKGEENRLLFFTLFSDGTFFPCAAIMNPQGKVAEILALSNRGEKMLANVSPGIIRLYIRRIEGRHD